MAPYFIILSVGFSTSLQRMWLLIQKSAAMGLRRPNLIKWDSYTNERLLELESMEGTLPSDKFLALWIRLQRIADDAGQRAVRDGISVLSLSDSKVSSWLPEVGEEMLNWKTLQPNEASSRKFVQIKLKAAE